MTIVEPFRFRLLRGTIPYLLSLVVEEGLRALGELLLPYPELAPPRPKDPVPVPGHVDIEASSPEAKTPRTALSDMCEQLGEATAPPTGLPRRETARARSRCGTSGPPVSEGDAGAPRAMWRPTGTRSKVDWISASAAGPVSAAHVGSRRHEEKTAPPATEDAGLPWRPERGEEGPPRVRLVPVERAALQARGCPGLADALRLASWVGSGAPLVRGSGPERLRSEDRSRAASDLGLTPKEIPQVFETALRAGFVHTTASEVRPEDALEIWRDDDRLVRAWARSLSILAGPDPAPRVLDILFTSGCGWHLEELAQELGDAEGLPAAVHALIRSGAVEPLPDGQVRITRLGDHGMAHRWRDRGEPPLEHPPTGGLRARELLLLLWDSRPVDAESMGAEWITERGAREAARSLLAACTDPVDWRLRVHAFRVLRGAGPEADEVLDSYRDHPVLGGWVAHARRRAGRVRPAQLVMAVLDTYALRVDSGMPLPQDTELWRDPEAVTRLMWGSGHPAADSVLSAIALGALGPRPARAARRTPVFYAG
ncbi:hypothetical protein [Nocardiopsis sp. JB363]|uniref:hypothetical protein n=1 Tax=Nocardiopsis sp. JB363 TaxID=1434837 RepID=UPI00097A2421|nr:hypothetical protein [Nocardiopsis sp. JB363]SIO90309.1 hypothetical protein BQ8420_26000 [Nocardiopsis sp. JB363]